MPKYKLISLLYIITLKVLRLIKILNSFLSKIIKTYHIFLFAFRRSSKYVQHTENMMPCIPLDIILVLRPLPNRPMMPSFSTIYLVASR